jgi:hypothetical protein
MTKNLRDKKQKNHIKFCLENCLVLDLLKLSMIKFNFNANVNIKNNGGNQTKKD